MRGCNRDLHRGRPGFPMAGMGQVLVETRLLWAGRGTLNASRGFSDLCAYVDDPLADGEKESPYFFNFWHALLRPLASPPCLAGLVVRPVHLYLIPKLGIEKERNKTGAQDHRDHANAPTRYLVSRKQQSRTSFIISFLWLC